MNDDKRNKRQSNAKHLTVGLFVALLFVGTSVPVSAADSTPIRKAIHIDEGVCDYSLGASMTASLWLTNCVPPVCEDQSCVPPVCENWDCVPPVCPDDSCDPPPVCEGDACDPPPVCEGGDCLPPAVNCTSDCGTLTPPACPGVPVVQGGHPNGSSWIIWMAPDISDIVGIGVAEGLVGYYVSWTLGAATLNNGADGYVFGAAIDVGPQTVEGVSSGTLSQAGCMYLGGVSSPQAGFDYMVQGGDYGTSGTETCSWEFSASITVGVEVSVFGPAGSASGTLGFSYGCGASTVFDSEVLIGQTGHFPL